MMSQIQRNLKVALNYPSCWWLQEKARITGRKMSCQLLIAGESFHQSGNVEKWRFEITEPKHQASVVSNIFPSFFSNLINFISPVSSDYNPYENE